ncbi:MAG: DNA topoisomerase I [Candidatus Cloacimonetes bacterium 4572_65]|nr:MAG: DNA topoisomerase I [Candidatus Cloacimonetes bacterium 4572_65]
MAKNLIIVESPAKAKTISKFLDNKYTIKASMGHIRDLPKTTLGIDVDDNFKAKYVTDRKKSKIIKELKEKAKTAPEIFLASDHDREGEAIAWHLKELLKKEIKDKPVHRITFNEITKKAIRDAIKHPGEIDMEKVNAQQARRILDRIVGYKISPILWKVIAKDLSAGRVQSVALRLVCEKEAEITAFVPEEFWKISANFWKDILPEFKGELDKLNGKKAKITNKEDADKVLSDLKQNEAILTDIKKSDRKVNPSAPYITSTLQQDASRISKFSPKRTMKIAQELYEGINLGGEHTGLITYMRTDSLRIADEAQEACRELVKTRYGADKLNPTLRTYKNKNKSQDAHEAIRPTDVFKTPESLKEHLSAEQFRIYSLIWNRFVATQMIPMALETVKVTVSVGAADFLTKGSIIREKGFTLAYHNTSVALGELVDPKYSVDDSLEAKDISSLQKFTQPPARYSEASLIKELEAKEIGRPSTYSSIISTITDRKYVALINRLLNPTELGEKVNKFLVAKFDSTFNVLFTAEMEKKLDSIEAGETEMGKILEVYYQELIRLIEGVDIAAEREKFLEKTDIVCDKCNEGHFIVRWGRQGEFLGCSNYPECKNIKNFHKDEEGTIIIDKEETLDEKCPKCNEPLIVKNGRYGKFIACSDYPKCKYTKPIDLGIKCPDCADGMLTEKKSKRGKTFYSCTNYPECKYVSWDKPVDIACPNCGNYYMNEKYSKAKGAVKTCPKCGEELH